MISQPPDIIQCLKSDIINIWSGSRVHGAGEHHIMPDQNSLFIANVIEEIIFVLATTPKSKHVVISINGGLDCLVVNIRVFESAWHKHVGRDVI